MKNILAFIRDKHDEIFKGFIFLISVILIVSIFPKEGKFRYEFTKGKPWLHQDLIASFDFAIQKTDEEIQQELKEINDNSQMFYQKDTSVITQLTQVFDRDFAVSWNKKHTYASSSEEKMDKAFKQATFKLVFNKYRFKLGDFFKLYVFVLFVFFKNNRISFTLRNFNRNNLIIEFSIFPCCCRTLVRFYSILILGFS
jgi:hypothetical protein